MFVPHARLAESLVERLRAALPRTPPIRLAVLFGSQATGRARGGSDVDIGLLPLEAGFSWNDEIALAARFSAASGAEVDLVRLDEDAPLLGAEVARTGICLWEEAPGTFSAYRARAMSTWIDFEEVMAPHRARFLARLANRRAAAP